MEDVESFTDQFSFHKPRKKDKDQLLFLYGIDDLGIKFMLKTHESEGKLYRKQQCQSKAHEVLEIAKSILKDRHNLICCKKYDVLLRTTVCQEFGDQLSTIKAQVEKNLPKTKKSYLSAVNNLSNEIWKNDVSYMEVSSKHPVFCSALPIIDHVAASDCQCWHCLPFKIMKSSSLTNIIRMKWECIRRRHLLRLLTGLGKLYRKQQCQSKAHEVLEIAKSILKDRHNLICCKKYDVLLRTTVCQEFGDQLSTIKAQVEKNLPKTKKSYLSAVNNLSNEIWKNDVSYMEVSSKHPVFCSALPIIDHVAASDCQCWHCLPFKIMKSSSLTNIIRMKWECIRRCHLLRLLTGLGKCYLAGDEIESARDVLMECISVLVGRNTFHRESSISSQLLTELIEKSIVADMFAIEHATILYDISWIALKSFCTSCMEEKWFGPWIPLLLGDCNLIDSSVVVKLKDDLKLECSFDAHESILKLAIGVAKHASQGIEFSSDLVLNKGCYIRSNNVHKQSPMGLHVLDLILNAVKGSKDPTNFIQAEPVIFVLDMDIQMLPWKNLPYLQKQEVYRMPSVAGISLAFAKFQEKFGQDWPNIDPTSAYYLLNPSKDLESLEKKMGTWLRDKGFKEGKAGAVPTLEEIKGALKTHVLFLYFGHKDGLKYIPAEEIRSIRSCGAAILFGCISCLLKEGGPYRPTGAPLEYLDADSPIIVGYLLEVIDSETSKFAQQLIGECLEQRSSSNKSRQSIASLINKARDECKYRLKHMTGAATVCYGIPMYIIKKKDV